jgi:hypothetical protein
VVHQVGSLPETTTIQFMVDKKELYYADYFYHLDSSITKDVGCTQEIQSRIVLAKTDLNKDKALLASKLNFNVRKKPERRYVWSIAFCIVLKLGHCGK